MQRARPDAFLVEPRVVRRVIRELHGFARLSTRIPHTDVLVVKDEDLRQLTHPDELGLEDFSRLPDLSVIVSQPEEHELENRPVQELLQLVWQRLFHGCIDLHLKRKLANNTLSRPRIQHFIDQVGQVEFDEAHAVLRSEHRLINPDSYVEAYCELVAVFLELTRFAPDRRRVWFPSLADEARLLSVLTQTLDEEKLFRETMLYGATMPDQTPGTVRDEARVASERQSWSEGDSRQPSARRFHRLVKKRARWSERGNTVAAAVCAIQAARCATTETDRQDSSTAAQADVAALADRLRQALKFRESDLDDWRQSLWELLQNSIHGFWNSDKRLLYDLQKVCLDHERTVYQVDLVKWVVSRGRRPLRRPLTNLREVMMAKHLASSASRLVFVRLSGAARERLSRLLHAAARLAEAQMRRRMRGPVHDTIAAVGLTARSVPEKVAFDKMVEEALDCITERGYLTMGYLRDAISRNDLKLPDLTDPKDLIRGDHLLRTDDRLDVTLDGVYRRGEFYLRWLQVVSSLAFGTRAGRFATLFIAIPFGGAVVIVVGLHHLIGVFTGSGHHEAETPVTDTSELAEVADTAVAESLNTGSAESSSEKNSAAQNFGTDRAGSGVEAVRADSVRADTSPGSPDAGPDDDNAAARTAVTDVPGTSLAVTSRDDGAVDSADGSPVDSADVGRTDTPAADRTASDQSMSAATDVAAATDAGGGPEQTSGASGPVDTTEAVTTTTAVVEEPHVLYQWVGDQTLPLSVAVGFLLMALIHLPKFRGVCWNVVRYAWNLFRTAVYDVPLRILRLPLVQRLWRSRWFTRLRRHVVNPLLLAWIGCRVLPSLLAKTPQPWWMVGAVGLLLSFAANSRLGRDAEELASEWLANAWHDLRSRFLVALFEWTIDFFKWLLNLLERFIYAVDEWLRFHSGETWLTLVAKAVLGVVWSFVSFLIRIYVNLLIEPTLHPVKHFPVVTVAHKIFLPVILIIESTMRSALTPYLGLALAGPITWFNIVFLPGIFGFLVWELKENWRLYASNRVPCLQPVVIGSHGENGGRLLKPGFHSGTLPKLYGRLRRLERKDPSFHRFSERRAFREVLEHAERDIRRFVERDLIRLLTYCVVWDQYDLNCRHIRAASNSFLVEVTCPRIGAEPLCLLFQEQSGWLVATVSEHGWLDSATPEQQHSFETALRGFYCKAGVDLVREQMERNLIGPHPYDVCSEGLKIWPERRFDRQIICDLHRRHQIRPTPPGLAASYGLQPVSREAVVFAESGVMWSEWKQVWATPDETDAPSRLPLACLQSARMALIRTYR